MCSDQEKVHSPCKIICPLYKNSEPGKLRQTERLQGCAWIFEKGACLFVSFTSFYLFVFRGEFVADVAALQTLLQHFCLPHQSLVPTHCFNFSSRGPWIIILYLAPDNCTSQVERDLSLRLRWLLLFFEEAAQAAELVGHFAFFHLPAKPSLVLSPAESTLWKLCLSHLLYNRLGQEKRFFRCSPQWNWH